MSTMIKTVEIPLAAFCTDNVKADVLPLYAHLLRECRLAGDEIMYKPHRVSASTGIPVNGLSRMVVYLERLGLIEVNRTRQKGKLYINATVQAFPARYVENYDRRVVEADRKENLQQLNKQILAKAAQ